MTRYIVLILNYWYYVVYHIFCYVCCIKCSTDWFSHSKKLPVLVYIYGGGFVAGSASLDPYNPSKLVDLGNVVFVAMHYRVGPLGWMYLGEDSFAQGNAGLLDQVSKPIQCATLLKLFMTPL